MTVQMLQILTIYLLLLHYVIANIAYSVSTPFPQWLTDITGLKKWPGLDPPFIPNIKLDNIPENSRYNHERCRTRWGYSPPKIAHLIAMVVALRQIFTPAQLLHKHLMMDLQYILTNY